MVMVLIALLVACTDRPELTPVATQVASPTPKQPATQPATTEVALAATDVPATATKPATIDVSPSATDTAVPTPNQPATPFIETTGIAPYPDAPLCPDSGEAHDNSLFHTLWDGVRGCHYDHEHGQYPFTAEVAAAFPDFDLRALLGPGAAGVGHTNPSSAMENTHKHGGFKWNVQLEHPEGCAPFEGSTLGVNGSVIQYHAFGDYSVELEGGIHSAAALIRQCYPDNPTDYGYMYVVQHVNYGQRVTPYQGTLIPYANNPEPGYDTALGPYLTIDCVGNVPQCRESLDYIRNHHAAVNSIWTSKAPRRLVDSGSPLFQLLFRLRDAYQVFDWNDFEYPFTFQFVCSPDGLNYDPLGCEYNNTTTQIHEIAGIIPADWDNLAGFDSDPEVGRITAEGFVTRFGDLNPACVAPGEDCHLIKLVRAFVGYYGSILVFTEGKGENIVPYLPERDIYFCGGRVCTEGDSEAVASGWPGQHN